MNNQNATAIYVRKKKGFLSGKGKHDRKPKAQLHTEKLRNRRNKRQIYEKIRITYVETQER